MAKQYSKPRDLRTSIMKSAPGRSVMRGSATGAEPASAAAAGAATRTCCAMAIGAGAASAAPLMKPRRPNEDFLDLATVGNLIEDPTWLAVPSQALREPPDKRYNAV